MIPSYFITLDKVPLTSNGKINRKALPAPESVIPGGEYVAPRNMIEKKLAAIWAEVLNINIEGRDALYAFPGISIDSNFFDIGGHSLKVLKLVNAIQKEFNVKINFQDIFQFSTIMGLYDLIRKSETIHHKEIEAQPKREYYELSYPQLRLWLLYKFEPDSPAFNFPVSFTLNECVDENIVRSVLEKLVERHESFRTYFKEIHGEPVQIIQAQSQVDLETIDLSHLNDNDREKRRSELFREESTLPFKLGAAPLFRAKLLKCKEEEFDVILTMHHIITDGWSMEVLAHEFSLLYESYKKGEEYKLKPLRIQYKDYVYWHNQLLSDKEKMRAAQEFWENQVKGELSILDLPYDFPKTNLDSKESGGYRIVVPEKIILGLKKIAREQNASLFMVLLAGFNLLLSRISGQNDILLGVPGAARQHEDLENIIGLFVNTLILRNKINPGESFITFLERVQRDTLQVLQHQSYPLELICSEFKIKYPEISVFFNMSIFGDSNKENLKDDKSYHIEQVQNAKFDIVSYLGEYKNGIEITTHYYKKLFKAMTIEKIMRLYVVILEHISQNPGKASKEYYRLPKKRKLKLN